MDEDVDDEVAPPVAATRLDEIEDGKEEDKGIGGGGVLGDVFKVIDTEDEGCTVDAIDWRLDVAAAAAAADTAAPIRFTRLFAVLELLVAVELEEELELFDGLFKLKPLLVLLMLLLFLNNNNPLLS